MLLDFLFPVCVCLFVLKFVRGFLWLLRFRNLWFSAFQFVIGGKQDMFAFFGIGQIPTKQTHILFILSNCHDFMNNRLFF